MSGRREMPIEANTRLLRGLFRILALFTVPSENVTSELEDTQLFIGLSVMGIELIARITHVFSYSPARSKNPHPRILTDRVIS